MPKVIIHVECANPSKKELPFGEVACPPTVRECNKCSFCTVTMQFSDYERLRDKAERLDTFYTLLGDSPVDSFKEEEDYGENEKEPCFLSE